MLGREKGRLRRAVPGGLAQAPPELNKTTVHMTGLVDQTVARSTKAYTEAPHLDGCSVFYGGLSAFWEAAAQGRMAKLGMAHRQISNITANVGTWYEPKVAGDPQGCTAVPAPTASPISGRQSRHMLPAPSCISARSTPQGGLVECIAPT